MSAVSTPETADLTVEQLLNMTSGISNYLNMVDAVVPAIVEDPTTVWAPEQLIVAGIAAGVDETRAPASERRHHPARTSHARLHRRRLHRRAGGGWRDRSAQHRHDRLDALYNSLYKAELIRGPDRRPWRSVEDVELATLGWVHWFNTERLHSYLDDQSTDEIEAAYAASQTDQPMVGIQ